MVADSICFLGYGTSKKIYEDSELLVVVCTAKFDCGPPSAAQHAQPLNQHPIKPSHAREGQSKADTSKNQSASDQRHVKQAIAC